MAGRLPRYSTACTPGNFSAWLISTDLTRACGCGLRSVRVYSVPGMVMCSVYWPSPVTMPIPWTRGNLSEATQRCMRLQGARDQLALLGHHLCPLWGLGDAGQLFGSETSRILCVRRHPQEIDCGCHS